VLDTATEASTLITNLHDETSKHNVQEWHVDNSKQGEKLLKIATKTSSLIYKLTHSSLQSQIARQTFHECICSLHRLATSKSCPHDWCRGSTLSVAHGGWIDDTFFHACRHSLRTLSREDRWQFRWPGLRPHDFRFGHWKRCSRAERRSKYWAHGQCLQKRWFLNMFVSSITDSTAPSTLSSSSLMSSRSCSKHCRI
jgi:hypothetical protein